MSGTIQRADRVIPGGCFGYTKLPDDLTFVASHGCGSRLWTDSGRELVDYTLGSGPLLLGHAHPAITEAVRAQAAKGTHFYAMNQPAIELAERIIDAVPSAQALKFCADGSQATFFAMRLARSVTGRTLILKFEGAYHGHHDYALPGFPGSNGQVGKVAPHYAGIPGAIGETVIVSPFNDLETTTALVRRYAGDLAAVIVEPVQRAIEPQPGFLAGLRQLCDEAGALLIFDEVVTGFRLSRGGAQELYGVTPDLTALGKAVGGGLPLGAVTGRRDHIEHVVPGDRPEDQRVFMSGTLNGNPLSAAAGSAMLKVLDEVDGPRRLAAHGRILAEGLRAVGARLGIDLRVFGPDVFIEVTFGAAAVTDYATYRATNRAAAAAFGTELLRGGVYVVPGTKFYISTEHDDRDAEDFLKTAETALVSIRDQGLVST